MNKFIQLYHASFMLALSLAGSAFAGPVSTAPVEVFNPYAKGVQELELGVSAYGGVSTAGSETRPDFSFGLGSLRYGWMLNDPMGDGCFRGNFEFLLGLFGGPTFSGPGSYHFGGDLNLRYNFVQPNATVVPYLQISGGGDYSDVAREDKVQDYLGTEWNWALGSSIGVRWMLSERCALTTAFEYRHFSNAGSSERNRGYNGLGGLVALAWFY